MIYKINVLSFLKISFLTEPHMFFRNACIARTSTRWSVVGNNNLFTLFYVNFTCRLHFVKFNLITSSSSYTNKNRCSRMEFSTFLLTISNRRRQKWSETQEVEKWGTEKKSANVSWRGRVEIEIQLIWRQ